MEVLPFDSKTSLSAEDGRIGGGLDGCTKDSASTKRPEAESRRPQESNCGLEFLVALLV